MEFTKDVFIIHVLSAHNQVNLRSIYKPRGIDTTIDHINPLPNFILYVINCEFYTLIQAMSVRFATFILESSGKTLLKHRNYLLLDIIVWLVKTSSPGKFIFYKEKRVWKLTNFNIGLMEFQIKTSKS